MFNNTQQGQGINYLLDYGNNNNQGNSFGQVSFGQQQQGQGLGGNNPFATQEPQSMFNMGNVGMGIDALGSLSQMYFGAQAIANQEKNNKFKRKAANRNLANQAKLTNAALEDRAISRSTGQGKQGDEMKAFVDGYLSKYKNDGSKI